MNECRFNTYLSFVESVVVFFLSLEVLFRRLPLNPLHVTPVLIIFKIECVCLKDGAVLVLTFPTST